MVSSENSSSLLIDEILTWNKSGVLTAGVYSITERVIMALLWIFICIFGSTGNTMVIIAVFLSKKLQTPTNAFVVCLATADLITCLLQILNTACLGFNGWPLPKTQWLCVINSLMLVCCIGVSLLNLAAISINRYILITKPLKTYQKIYTPVNTGIMVASSWVTPVFVQLSVILYLVKQNPQAGKFAFTLVEALCISFSLLTIITSYTLVFRHVRKHSKKIRNHQPRDITTSRSGTRQASYQKEHIGAGFSKVDLDVTKNLLMMVVAFFICFMPYNIYVLISWRPSVRLYALLFVYVSSCINPVIYARRHPHFKVVLGAMIKCQYQNIPEPTGVLRRFISRRINPNP